MDNEYKLNVLKNLRSELLSVVYGKTSDIDEDNKVAMRMKSGITGLAIGDALGVPVEFVERDVLKKHPLKEMVGFRAHMVPAGTWSDDTAMTLATMDSIINNGCINYNDIMSNFLKWYRSAKYTATFVTFDIGNTSRRALDKYASGVNLEHCGCSRGNDNGNGSLMRMLPIAYYLYSNNFSDEAEVYIINKISSLTHGHEISCLGCKIYCDYVKQLLDGCDKFEALDYIKQFPYNRFYSEKSIYKYKKILSGNICKLSDDRVRSTGYVVDTLGASLWSILNTDNYEDALVKAVNLGGDTDTIGAITGSLGGLIYGNMEIPKKWLYRLKRRGYLEYMNNKFVNNLVKKNKGLSK